MQSIIWLCLLVMLFGDNTAFADDTLDASELSETIEDHIEEEEEDLQQPAMQFHDIPIDINALLLRDLLQATPWVKQQKIWPARFDIAAPDPFGPQRPCFEDGLLMQQLPLLQHMQPTFSQHIQLAFDIPIMNHPLVNNYIAYFTGRGRPLFTKWLERKTRYMPLMQDILQKQGVPKDLIYVAMIESGFSSHAVSSARAAGYWQFMNATGKYFGLQHDMWIDERRDFVRATEAAALYLSQLYKEFGDWHLSWAAYNAGPGRLRRAMEKYNTRNFWQLISYKKSLATETMHYVPKIIATAMIAKNPERYGFRDLKLEKPLVYDEITVRQATDLRKVAKHTNISLHTLRELNPSLLHDITPPNKQITLRVPPKQGTAVASILNRLPSEERLNYKPHHIRQGDTLSSIAHHYHTSVDAIQSFNKLHDKRLPVGKTLLIPIVTNTRPIKYNKYMAKHHVVASGETLWSIAQHYRTSVKHIKNRNRRSSNALAVGEVLQIF